MQEAAAHFGLDVHAYMLMTNHVHLLATPRHAQSLPRTMQALGRRYVQWINTTQSRTGTLWEGRYKACLIDSEAWFFRGCAYLDMNPVRARMVRHPMDYAWSSYHALAEGTPDPLITPHALYEKLAPTAADRQEIYRSVVETRLAEKELDTIRQTAQGGWVLGDEAFQARLSLQSARPTAPRPRGRPPREREKEENPL